MKRREFITLIGGATAAWPLAARAQQRERMRRIGVLLPSTADDSEYQAWVGAFLQGLAQSGWITGRNIRIETRWTKFDPEETRKYAAELVALAPDVILATGTSTVGPLLRLTRTVPIVFPLAADPVAAGLVESLARPGGNATGFMSFEIGFSAKWLELLKEIAPGIKRVAVLRTLATAAGPGQFGVIQAVAPSLGVELRPIDTQEAGEIERAIVAFASEPNGGLIAATGGGVVRHRELIVALAARHRLPAIYAYRSHVMIGGLMSYALERIESGVRFCRQATRALARDGSWSAPICCPCQSRQFLPRAGAGGSSGGVSHARPRGLPVRHPAGSRHRGRLRGVEGSCRGDLCRR